MNDAERSILAMFISKKKEAKKLAKKERILMDFIKKLQELNCDEGLLRAYNHELAEKEEAERVGERKGERRGKKKGIAEAQTKIVTNMIKKGVSTNIIGEYTGLTIDQIEKMRCSIDSCI